jgi:hypothetical protein
MMYIPLHLMFAKGRGMGHKQQASTTQQGFKVKFGQPLTADQRRQATQQLSGASWTNDNQTELIYPANFTPELQQQISAIQAMGGTIEITPLQSAGDVGGNSQTATGYSPATDDRARRH